MGAAWIRLHAGEEYARDYAARQLHSWPSPWWRRLGGLAGDGNFLTGCSTRPRPGDSPTSNSPVGLANVLAVRLYQRVGAVIASDGRSARMIAI